MTSDIPSYGVLACDRTFKEYHSSLETIKNSRCKTRSTAFRQPAISIRVLRNDETTIHWYLILLHTIQSVTKVRRAISYLCHPKVNQAVNQATMSSEIKLQITQKQTNEVCGWWTRHWHNKQALRLHQGRSTIIWWWNLQQGQLKSED